MNVNADALSRNPIDDNKEISKNLQAGDDDTFMTSQEKMFYKKKLLQEINEKTLKMR